MAIPPNRELRLRFDAQGRLTLGDVRNLAFVANQDVKLDIRIQLLDDSNVPPVYNNVDVTTWISGRLVAKNDIDDADPPTLDVAMTKVDATNGLWTLTIPKASLSFTAELMYAELIFVTSGTDPDIRVPLQLTFTQEGITI